MIVTKNHFRNRRLINKIELRQADSASPRETRKENEDRRREDTSTTYSGREDSVPDERQAQTALHSIPAAGGRH